MGSVFGPFDVFGNSRMARFYGAIGSDIRMVFESPCNVDQRMLFWQPPTPICLK